MPELDQYLADLRSDEEIYHDLMSFRVREILLVATEYDAFILQQDGRLSDTIHELYYALNLSLAPRITSVSCGHEALEKLAAKHYDLVILTMRIDEMSPFELCAEIKRVHPELPVFLLLNDNLDLNLIAGREDRLPAFEKVFVWNGDSGVFVALVKYLEDKRNAAKDTEIGLVRIILLVEDSVRYYSRYLPILFARIMHQTQRLIDLDRLSHQDRMFKMRVRPKVLLAVNYEEAQALYRRYRDYLLCVISDVSFPREGTIDRQAGLRLVREIREECPDLPVLFQSSDPENAFRAEELTAGFLDKGSDTLENDLQLYIQQHLGFGDFIFRDHTGTEIARAGHMEEFKGLLESVPEESLSYHASRNHFSAWLMARGEIQIAKAIQPLKVGDFASLGEVRQFLLQVCHRIHFRFTRGRIAGYHDALLAEEGIILRLGDGPAGGKARGMAFLNSLLEEGRIHDRIGSARIAIPKTAIIGTDEYDWFIEHNEIRSKLGEITDPHEVRALFLRGRLSHRLITRLRKFLAVNTYPLAVRSSSLFEDSLSQPFAGVYSTFMLPNNAPDVGRRLADLTRAIRLVYTSLFSHDAQAYFEAVGYKTEEEKMGIIVQEVVGQAMDGYFYPHFSGVAQSHNYYPVAYLEPGEGIAVVGVGLGSYIVDGQKAHRFCPRYPQLEFVSIEDQLRDSQTFFYAVDLAEQPHDQPLPPEPTLTRLDLSVAEKAGALNHIASVWDVQDQQIRPGLGAPGPRVINFGNILRYNSFPLAEILDHILQVGARAMGTPVEIEFAVNLERKTLYLLQIKHLLRNLEEAKIDLERIDEERLLLYSEPAMGNGKITGLTDIVFADPDRFERGHTRVIAEEIESLNAALKAEGRPYVLIGPGRWGTRDPWLGIPVAWSQISGARVIVEINLEDLRTDPSLGSHFFHNVTSMNIAYFAIPWGSETNRLDWSWLRTQPIHNRTEHLIHLRLSAPLEVMIDGRKRRAVIYHPSSA